MRPPRVVVCDYGVGNLRSVERALQRGGAEVVVSGEPATVMAADGVVLPGVGAFTTATRALRAAGLDAAVRAVAGAGTPLLGVCLGFQVLFDESDEGEGDAGLGLVGGRVRRLSAASGRVPHVGWNTLAVQGGCPLLEGIPDGTRMYFTHSYAAIAASADDVVATTDRGGEPLVAMVRRGNVAGTQFHPEKSGTAGLRLYASFVRACAA
ncbi:MAG: imidazole glycerol phosphate synthase subunit HisH [Candidatus Dormibacteria bacterium]